MKLIATDYCPFCLRCNLVLEKKEIEYELSLVDLTKKAEFLEQLSPYGRVPVLIHAGKSIYESSVICEYLEDICPEPALLPAEPRMRAKARFWIDFCNTRFMPTYFNLLKSSPGAGRDVLRSKLIDHLAFMDQSGLSKQSHDTPFWMGENIGLVDFTFYPFFERFADVEQYRGVEIPPKLRHLHDWIEVMRAQPVIRKFSRPRDHYITYFEKYYAD